ncbi:cell division ATP-binding protein FtsE [Pseudohongiella nitratireducens]|jgi:cell division transport system ATP-binding protein|uniref:Cell division ATP-binding protein FtsE n=1 Tax=Pseudohongiella nitratireducens TaxID=1768907 RepID=A0A917GM56_9GAMM|nr:cell division ATP-binding protein FtsE [Pseudohongiella nitratireducens]MDF1622083.1 cell division ATP-binding protein FtsE [Pseudohongiella nitratireducens]GGG51550.1 cell division ATP-binding protein FtsE [Pseudohongiella nitratireducens]|tara:strand:- start:4571 stop:5263 length:693 start_codon:yes stop_codon:yes gene_type:complete
MIRFDEVSQRYPGGHEALKQVSFELERGEMAFLTGRSGAGKSTLLKCIMRTESLSQGQILVSGRNIQRISDKQIPFYRRRIGVVFQDHQLLYDRSVYENVALPLRIDGYREADAARRVRAALDKVGLLSKEKMNPIALSGGEQQRVGIARAVVNRPQILLADEPTGNLDPELAADIMKLFEQFNQIGVSMLIASHDLALITRLRHRMLTLDNGRLIRDEQHPSRQGAGSS